jgi:hypothetical protein
MSSSALELFFSSATQYYISGRYAVFAGLGPVVGNLLHHALEMYLKGALSKTMPLDQLKKLSHNLPKVWKCFKAQVADPGLDTFDALISSLHAFEELRYPDSALSRGIMVKISVSRVPGASTGAPARREPRYELYLEEVDALVDKIFATASVDPRFFLHGLNSHARKYLNEANVHWWAR